MHNTHTHLLVRIKRTFVRTLKILLALAFVLALCAAYARWVEPNWICVKHIRLAAAPTVRVIHVSDIHFTGGSLLSRNAILVPSKHVALLTRASRHEQTPTGYKRILLEHQPELVAQIQDARFDLALAGHTHGGQSRIPIVRQLIGPSDFDTYRRGLFQMPCGSLYVNPGIGTFHMKVRFWCRPEVTVLEL